MNSACDTVVHCVSVESKICIPRKGFSQSGYRTHSLMSFGKCAMCVLRTLLRSILSMEYWWKMKLEWSGLNKASGLDLIVMTVVSNDCKLEKCSLSQVLWRHLFTTIWNACDLFPDRFELKLVWIVYLYFSFSEILFYFH